MARIRSIKPEFWVDEKVVELTPWARLLFIGLWNFADDEGRMEYREKKIKMQIFPADDLNISELFGEIRREGLVSVYVVDGREYLQVNGFAEHQKIDKRSSSKLPPPPESSPNPPESPRVPTTDQGRDQGRDQGSPPTPPRGNRFAEFWSAYPNKTGKKPAAEKWKRKRLDTMAQVIIGDVKRRAAEDRRWLDGYVPNPATYLTQERWNDEIHRRSGSAGGEPERSPYRPMAGDAS